MSAEKYRLKVKYVLLALSIVGLLLFSGVPAHAGTAADNRIFAELLTKYNNNGDVDYAGFKKEESRLDAYLDVLAEIKPASLSRNDRFAFYANAYNAWTIKLILTGYPGVESIKDLGSFFKSPWKKEFVRIGGEIISLDTIEHDILRPQFKDPRVHMAVNCASKSCPPLWGEPFAGNRLDDQLNAAASNFVNNPRFNHLEGDTLYVSRIFKWFSEDFDNDVFSFFEKYGEGQLKMTVQANRSALDVEFLDYDWSLNGR